MPHLFMLESDVIPPSALVMGLEGDEGISQLFEMRVGLMLRDGASLDLSAAVGASADLVINSDAEQPIRYHGILASVELLHAWQGQVLYQAVLVPRLWRLGLTRHSWVWTDKTIDAVIQDVLERNGLSGDDFSFQLEASYETREHVCQFEESDLAFIARWMEREGIYFFFDHAGDVDKLVLCDSRTFHDKSRELPLRYVPSGGGDHMGLDALDTFRCRRRALPSELQQADYNYRQPSTTPTGTAAIDGASSGVVRHFGQNFREDGEGGRLARVHAEAHLATQAVFHGHGRAFGLRAGYLWTLSEHPLDELNGDYLAVRLHHVGNQASGSPRAQELLGLVGAEDEYRVEVEAIAKDVAYRHPRTAPVPRVEGAIHALVDGPADSDYAQIDDQGRYLVRLMLDESAADDGAASMRVRMMQPHAGSPEGFHFPLRKETEVLLIFLGGDPDRPVIAGAIPNPQTPSPVIESNHTENVIWTGGNNRMVMEDQDGGQYIHIHTPTKDTYQRMGAALEGDHLRQHTDGDHGLVVGKTSTVEIGDDGGGTLTETVHGDVTETYEANHNTDITDNRNLTVGVDQVVDVGAAEEYTVGANQTIDVGGSRDTTIGQDETIDVGGAQWHHITGRRDVITDGQQTIEVKGGFSSNKTTGKYKIECDQHEVFVLGGGMTESVRGGYRGQVHGGFQCNVTGNYTLDVTGEYSCNYHQDFWDKHLANETKFQLGMSNGIFIGLKNDVFVGFKNSASISMAADLTLGTKLSLSAGAKAEFGGLTDLRKKAPVEIEMASLKLKTIGGATVEFTGGKLVL